MYVVRKPLSATMSAANEAQLPSTTALWRIEKFPVSEIREHLQAAGLPLTDNKRALAKRLYNSMRARSHSSAEDEASSSHSREGQDEQSPSLDADSPDLTRRHHSTRHGRSVVSRSHAFSGGEGLVKCLYATCSPLQECLQTNQIAGF